MILYFTSVFLLFVQTDIIQRWFLLSVLQDFTKLLHHLLLRINLAEEVIHLRFQKVWGLDCETKKDDTSIEKPKHLDRRLVAGCSVGPPPPC